MAKKQQKPRIGRPPKPPGTHEVRPVRQCGRWSDEEWADVRAMAEASGMSVAALIKQLLRRRLKRFSD